LGAKVLIVKDGGFIDGKAALEWVKAMSGRSINDYTRFAALLCCFNGQMIAVMQEAPSEWLKVCFNGLTQYAKEALRLSDGALQRRAIFCEFISVWRDNATLFRTDFCADTPLTIAEYKRMKTHRALLKRRKLRNERTTLYYQGKESRYISVLAYDKANKNGLLYPMVRLEFCFMRGFWNRNVKDEQTINEPLELFNLAKERGARAINGF
jgi:hypothetical protein